MKVKCHLGKANVVVDALSRKLTGLMASLLTTKRRLLRELEALQIVLSRDGGYMAALQVTSPLVEEIKSQ